MDSSYNSVPELSDDEQVRLRVHRACSVIQDRLSSGRSLYGVTTGVGASGTQFVIVIEGRVYRSLTKEST